MGILDSNNRILISKDTRKLIYGLVDPKTFELRYIGQSSRGLKRARDHFRPKEIRKNDYVHNWLRSLRDENGYDALIFILEEWHGIGNVVDWLNEREILWIKIARENGFKLTNLTDGGGGRSGFKPSEETRRKIGLKKKGVKLSPEAVENITKANRKRYENHVYKIKPTKNTEENEKNRRIKISAALKLRDPEIRKIAAIKTVAKRKANGSYANSEKTRKKISESVSKSIKEWWAKRKSGSL